VETLIRSDSGYVHGGLQDVNGVLSLAAVKTEKSRRQIHLPKRAIAALKEHRELSVREGIHHDTERARFLDS